MNRLRGVLDRLNDIEATIARLDGAGAAEVPLAYRLSVQSLEKRREELREELADCRCNLVGIFRYCG